MSRNYCKQVGLPFYIVGRNSRFPPGCDVFGNPISTNTGSIKVRFPKKFAPVEETIEQPVTIANVRTLVIEKIGNDRDYLLVVWSGSKEQAWNLPNKSLRIQGKAEIHVLVYDGCFEGGSLDPVMATGFAELPMQRVANIDFFGNVYQRKAKENLETDVTAVRIKAFASEWATEPYAENDLYYSDDSSDDNNKFLWQIKKDRQEKRWNIFPLDGKDGRTLFPTSARVKAGNVVYVTRSSNRRLWWWQPVDRSLQTFSTPAAYGMDFSNPKRPMPRSKENEVWYEKIGWQRKNVEEYMSSVVALSYPVIQRRIKSGAQAVMCLGKGGTYLAEESGNALFYKTDTELLNKIGEFANKKGVDMPTSDVDAIKAWFKNTDDYFLIKQVDDSFCKNYPVPTNNAWGGILDDKISFTIARYLVPEPETVFEGDHPILRPKLFYPHWYQKS